jgi:hypothetical protein
VSKINTKSQSHDKRAIKEFLMHLAGELRLQELALEGKPVPPKLQQGVRERRTKFGSELLPDAGLLCFLANDPDDEGDAQRDAARQAVVSRRRDQLKQVMGVIELLGELET